MVSTSSEIYGEKELLNEGTQQQEKNKVYKGSRRNINFGYKIIKAMVSFTDTNITPTLASQRIVQRQKM